MSSLISILPTLGLVLVVVALWLLRRRVQGRRRHDAQFYRTSAKVLGIAGIVIFAMSVIAYWGGFWYTDVHEFVVVTFIMIPLVFGVLVMLSIKMVRSARNQQ